jgi:hypothetical protein
MKQFGQCAHADTTNANKMHTGSGLDFDHAGNPQIYVKCIFGEWNKTK